MHNRLLNEMVYNLFKNQEINDVPSNLMFKFEE